nr:MAG TPA: Single-stranded DNA-binding protein [Caudoviricetes sp.]
MAVKKQNKKQTEKVKYWSSDLTGRMRVYAQEVNYKKNGKPASFLKFSTSLGVKDEDGNWSNLYFNVRFMKGDAPEVDGGMNFEIDISKAFLTFETFTTKDDEEVKTLVIVVQEWCDPDSDGQDLPF